MKIAAYCRVSTEKEAQIDSLEKQIEFFNEFTLKMEKRNGAEFYAGPVTPATPAGEYSVYISVGKRDGTPIYELPLENSDGHKRYKIGTISLKEPKTPGVEIKVRNDSPQGITW